MTSDENIVLEGVSEADVLLDTAVSSAAVRATLRPTSRGKIVGKHDSIRRAIETAERVARSNCTVLITGESGTGKELVVAALHDASVRGRKPLVTVNCGAIPENLVESELFGHAKGSFTGAHASRTGFVAAAESGTLFLDEIGELPLAAQVKLLRLLQQKEYSPVGDSRVVKCDVRVVAATHRNLEEEVARGRFREDLYFRLNVIHIHLPPLRERPEDIPLLARHFLEVCKERSERLDIVGFSEEALAVIAAYPWPGNVRALENAIESAVLLAPGPNIAVDDLPERLRTKISSDSERRMRVAEPIPTDGLDLRAAVEEYENQLIREALQRSGYNKNRAAQLLKINRTTLVEMVKRKGL